MKNKNLLTFLVGAAAGAFATWLLTSDEGKKLASRVKDKIEDLIQPEADRDVQSSQESQTHES